MIEQQTPAKPVIPDGWEPESTEPDMSSVEAWGKRLWDAMVRLSSGAAPAGNPKVIAEWARKRAEALQDEWESTITKAYEEAFEAHYRTTNNSTSEQQQQQASKYEGHTPEPWRISNRYASDVVDANGYIIAEAAGVHLHEDHHGDTHWASTPGAHREMSEEEEWANAALMADAPALLARAERAEAQRDELLAVLVACEHALRMYDMDKGRCDPPSMEALRVAIANARNNESEGA